MNGGILVTGASGFIGSHLVPALAGRGFRVRAALRRLQALRDAGPGIEAVEIGDIAQDVDWGPALAGIGAVVHLAGLAHTGASKAVETYDRVNRWATLRLAHAAREAGARLVFLSSVRAQVGPTAFGVLTEESPPSPTDAYGRSKLAAERDIAMLGGRYVILRPTLVYGRGVGGNMGALIRLARLPLPLPFRAIRNARSLLAVENLIAAIMLALTSEAALGRTFLVADATPVSLADIITHLRRGGGRGAGLVPVPGAFMGGALKLIGRAELWDRLSGDLTVSIARLAAIGYAPPVTPPDALLALGKYQ